MYKYKRWAVGDTVESPLALEDLDDAYCVVEDVPPEVARMWVLIAAHAAKIGDAKQSAWEVLVEYRGKWKENLAVVISVTKGETASITAIGFENRRYILVTWNP